MSLAEAFFQFKVGDIDGAERLARAVLRREKGNVQAMLFLAEIYSHSKRFTDCCEILDRAASLRPKDLQLRYNLGVALTKCTRYNNAINVFKRILENDPDHEASKINLAACFMATGDSESAGSIYESLIKESPNSIEFFINYLEFLVHVQENVKVLEILSLHQDNFIMSIAVKILKGKALNNLKRYDEAINIFNEVLHESPNHVEALNGLGFAQLKLGKTNDSIQNFNLVINKNPYFFQGLINLANALHEGQHFDEASRAYRHAIHCLEMMNQSSQERLLRNSTSKVLISSLKNDLAVCLLNLNQTCEALKILEEIISFNPNLAEAYVNRGKCLLQLMQLEAALEAFEKATCLSPSAAGPACDKGITYLLLGNLFEGWKFYEKRKELSEAPLGVNKTHYPDLKNLTQIKGRNILVDAEQGLGDTIHFSRYARLLADQGAQVTFRVQPVLHSLMQSLDARVTILKMDQTPPHAQFHVALMSLPGLFGTDETTVPYQQKYLSAEPARVEKWKAYLGEDGFKIGIVWQGNKAAKIDLGRSFSLAHFKALAGIENIRLISLQKNEGSEELATIGRELGIETLGDDFDTGDQAFLDSAAVMENLDLIVTSDTALAHLAGALGVPVWIALQHVPDWRWMLERTDSPWYPTARLFRQKQRGDWEAVFAEIKVALLEMISMRS